MSSLAAGGIRPALARAVRARRGVAGGALLVVSASVTGAALAVAGARVLHAPALVAIVVLGSAAAGAAAAFALPLKLRETPKRVTEPVLPAELERVVVRRWLTAAILLGIAIVALVVRLWHFNDVGYNSDEAVYAGQGAGLAHDPQLAPYFPVFRAHPLLFQSVIAIGYELHQGDWFGRAAAIGFGVLCVLATFELGRLLYGVRVGPDRRGRARADALPRDRQPADPPGRASDAASRPSRCASSSASRAPAAQVWLYAAAAAMGLSVLAKEPSVIFCGAIYAFFALSPEIRDAPARRPDRRSRCIAITIAPYPLALLLSGQTGTGGNFLAWQLFASRTTA